MRSEARALGGTRVVGIVLGDYPGQVGHPETAEEPSNLLLWDWEMCACGMSRSPLRRRIFWEAGSSLEPCIGFEDGHPWLGSPGRPSVWMWEVMEQLCTELFVGTLQ